MPGLQGENVVSALGSPIKRSKLSLKFFHRKETKRALDFSEPQSDEPKGSEQGEPEASTCDQVVPGPSLCPSSPGRLLPCEKKENLVPFVGFNNLGNTCYLNSILQVLCYCPGLRDGIKKLYELSKVKEDLKEETDKSKELSDRAAEGVPAHIELLESFNGLITSAEQLQYSFLLNPGNYSDGELATPPRKILHTLRRLNPMYEGYLQHDAQEVLQCIVGYIQEACDTIKKEQQLTSEHDTGAEVKTDSAPDDQVSGKRKSDTEAGNAKKKPKSATSDKCEEEEGEDVKRPLTRSKRRSDQGIKDEEAVEGGSDSEAKSERTVKEEGGKRKKRSRLSWLRPSVKQPSIFSKFRSVGKISSLAVKSEIKPEEESAQTREDKDQDEKPELNVAQDKAAIHRGGLDLMQHLFQGQLVLRTRCLECESFTERREDFHDISVPVLDDQPCSPDELSEVSPDPKPELKTLKWAIGQFASVERIFGEDKYFCETCHHYTEAERSLLFDKTPEVITIHLKRFSANGLDLDPYAGLSKVNTPLQTPLTLSLDEWCTRPASAKGQRYELFAVVMHSGVTISSGHYTAYVRTCDLKDARLSPPHKEEDDDGEDGVEKEAKDEALDYDDGEVSFSLNARGQNGGSSAGSKRGKKLSEGGVGLLGGQRSFSCGEFGGSGESAGKAEGCKRRKTLGSLGQNGDAGLKKEPKDEAGAASEQQALNGLLQYEGKWMLFDDSEVRLFEEEEFVRACSPDTSSSSTPYLLFYRRMHPAATR